MAVRKKIPLIPTDSALTIGAGKTLSTAVNLDVSGADVTVVGSGVAVITFPAATSTLATLAGTETLTNKTLTSPKINEAVALTSTATELNILDGATLTVTELNYVDGVTSALQTQLNAKAASLGADDNYVTDAEKVVIGNTSGTNTGNQTLPVKATKAERAAGTDDAKFLTSLSNIESLLLPEGGFLNGKIVTSVATSHLTVALKGKDGSDPSATNPVYAMIGGVLRSITSALSVTLVDATNWFNAGSAELATKEIDYFAYLGYNATDGVTIGFSRIPFARQYSDFSTTTTNEKYCAISTITTAAATDYYNVIGRFAATLSATAAFTWTVPTFTAINLIQRPIYNSRRLIWNPAIAAGGGSFTTVSASCSYMVMPGGMDVEILVSITTNGSAAVYIRLTTPFVPPSSIFLAGKEQNVTGKMVTAQAISSVYYAIVDYANAYPGGTGYSVGCRGFVVIE